MSISIEKPAVFVSQGSPCYPWPWIFSLGLHGLLLLLLLALAHNGALGAHPAIQVSLLAPEVESNGQALPQPPVTVPLPQLRQSTQTPRTTAIRTQPHNRPAAAAQTYKQQTQNNGNAEYVEHNAPSGQGGGKTVEPGPYEAGQVDKIPAIIQRVEPVYPQAARRRNIEGWVQVRFLVDHKGQVRQEKIMQAQPSGVFENSALAALRAWRFSPGQIQGQAVDTWMVQVVRFRLKS